MNYCRECIYKNIPLEAEPCITCVKDGKHRFFIKDNIKVYENDISEVFKRYGQMKFQQGYNRAITDIIHLLEN